MTLKRKILFTCILLGIGFGVGALLGEAMVRVFAPQQLIPPCAINDGEVAFRGKADCAYVEDRFAQYFTYPIQHNNYGFRMSHDLGEKQKPRVLCIGDSFTYGWGLSPEDTYLEKLQAQQTEVEYINAAYPGYGTGHCIKTLEKYADDLNVDRVIYFMYFNDLFDNVNEDINYRTHQWGTDSLLQTVQVYSPSKRFWHQLGVADWLYKNSHLVIFLKEWLQPSPQSKRIGLRPALSTSEVSPKRSQEIIQQSLAYLQLLVQECEARNLPLLVVNIPCWQELPLKNDYAWENVFPFEVFKKELKASIDQEAWAIQFFDPLACLEARVQTSRTEAYSTYYFGEGHYNERGHQIFFDCIENKVAQFCAPIRGEE